jgi:hypothetical protein
VTVQQEQRFDRELGRLEQAVEALTAALPLLVTKELCKQMHGENAKAIQALVEIKWRSRALWLSTGALMVSIVALVLTYTIGPL